MQLSAVAWREDDQEHTTLSNENGRLVTIGFVHEDSGQIMLITAFPDGTLTLTYGPIRNEPPEFSHLLGRFSENGVLEIHEPRPL
jgi:hypothetical protein